MHTIQRMIIKKNTKKKKLLYFLVGNVIFEGFS